MKVNKWDTEMAHQFTSTISYQNYKKIVVDKVKKLLYGIALLILLVFTWSSFISAAVIPNAERGSYVVRDGVLDWWFIEGNGHAGLIDKFSNSGNATYIIDILGPGDVVRTRTYSQFLGENNLKGIGHPSMLDGKTTIEEEAYRSEVILQAAEAVGKPYVIAYYIDGADIIYLYKYSFFSSIIHERTYLSGGTPVVAESYRCDGLVEWAYEAAIGKLYYSGQTGYIPQDNGVYKINDGNIFLVGVTPKYLYQSALPNSKTNVTLTTEDIPDMRNLVDAPVITGNNYDVTWSIPVDKSGIRKYQYGWVDSTMINYDRTTLLSLTETTSTSVTNKSMPTTPNYYYFVVYAMDNLGHWSSSTTRYISPSYLLSTPQFTLGDRTQVVLANVNVRTTPGGDNIEGTEPVGGKGTVVGGPQGVVYNGVYWTWWQIDWDDGLSGWSVGNYLGPTSTNNPPYLPNGGALAQFKTDGTPITAGGTTDESTVVFKGTVSDPDNDQVKLQIELRPMNQGFTGNYTHQSGLVSSGGRPSITAYGLANGNYHWQGRAVDSKGATSGWVDAGNPDPNIDLVVSVSTTGLPDLIPFTPPGWSAPLILRTDQGCDLNSCSPISSFTDTDTLYVNWAVLNDSSVDTTNYFVGKVYVDGLEKSSWTVPKATDPPLQGNKGYAWWNSSIGYFSPGQHTIKLSIDTSNSINESKEGNNEYSSTFTVNSTTGSLRVTIVPQEAINASAFWRVDGGAWHNSGYTQSGLSVGIHTLEFRAITGWAKPSNQTVTINAGQTKTTSGTYTQSTVTMTAPDPAAGEPSDQGVFRVSRTGSTSTSLTVYYGSTGTATPGSDYNSLPGNVTISAGLTTANFIVTPIDDSLVEGDETVIVTLSSNSNYQIGSPNNATVTIADNDVALLPTVIMTAPDPAAGEPSDPGTFTVHRTGSTSASLDVNYIISATATPGSDYNSLSGNVTIPAGSTTANITVIPIDDTLVEGDETVNATLNSSPNYQIGSPSNATVTIADNDVAPSITAQSVTNITPATARLNAEFDPHGLSTTHYFEYGTTDSYGSTTTPINSGPADGGVSVYISNLVPNTTYYFRFVISSSVGTTYGSDEIFTTNDGIGPSLNITSHNDGDHVNIPIITLIGDASDVGKGDKGIQKVTLNGDRANNDTATGSGAANWDKDINLNPGENQITVIAYDNSTNNNSTSQSIKIFYDPPVVYIEPNGTCGGNTPCFSKVQDGINAAGDGTTIRVAQETYNENMSIISSISNLLIQGGWSSDFSTRSEDPSLTIIDGDTTGDGIGDGSVFTINANNIDIDVTIEGFTLTRGNGGGVLAHSDNGTTVLTLKNNTIIENSADMGGGISIGSSNSGNMEVNCLNNTISKNYVFGSGGGVNISSPGGIISVNMKNNIITDNSAYWSAGGLLVTSNGIGSTTLIMTNNTITGNSAENIISGLGVYAGSSDNGNLGIDITNTIIWGNATSVSGNDIYIRELDSSGDSTAIVNASYSNVGDVVNNGGKYNDLGGNINADPNFADPASGDYHLTIGSPCIDKGTDNDAPPTDFEGDTRPYDGDNDGTATVDMGADEVICDYTLYYEDADQDGYGNPAVSVEVCAQPSGYVANNTDCDDTDPDINPVATEVCGNGIDEDCDDQDDTCPPNCTDNDGDSYGVGADCLGSDCDDNDSSVNPGATEVPYNSKDDDCNPDTKDDDLDGDGYGIADDCDDNDSSINPGATEVPYNSKDDDCNPATKDDDLDGDGYGIADDCDDTNLDINPGAIEICGNGVDEDCDGLHADCPPCTDYFISPESREFDKDGGSGSVRVTAADGCDWAASSNDSWIIIDSGNSGSGDGTVDYSVSANTETISRKGTMTIAGKTFEVTQAGIIGPIECPKSISHLSKSFGPGGGTDNVNVVAPDGCNWTASSSDPSWLKITSGNNGSGDGTVSYSVLSNTSSSRTATIMIVGSDTSKALMVTQLGVGPNIKANGSDVSVTLGTSDFLSVSVSLNAGGSLGVECDLWLIVNTPTGEWEYFDLSLGDYVPGLIPTLQGELFNLGSTEIFNTSDLAEGTYTYYFAVDLNMNGTLDTGAGILFSDSVEVTVTDTCLPKIYANGSGGTVNINEGDLLAIAISLSSGSFSGTSADWWIVVNTPSGWQYYDLNLGDYTPGLMPSLQGFSLVDFGSTVIFNMSGSGAGTYTYYFAVDLGGGQVFFKSVDVIVNISP